MKRLNDHLDLDQFFDRLRRSERSVLMLDYDGTLAPFVQRRDQAVPYPGVRERLIRLNDSPTHLSLVTGRAADELLPLLGMETPPEIWGSHGGERRLPDSTTTLLDLPPSTLDGLQAVDQWARAEQLAEHLEHKPFSVALHWRGLPQQTAQDLAARVREKWGNSLMACGLESHDFDGGVELRAVGINKGVAVQQLLAELPADTPAAYLGDDATDEDAFAMLKHRGLKVLVRPSERETIADLWLVPPDELLAFLDRWLDCVG